VFGVALASCTELTFTWFGFITAMVSNFFYQLRIVVSKPLIVTHSDGSKLSGGNLFRLLTIIAAVFLTPIALCLEGNSILPAWSAAASSRGAANAIMIDIIISGFSFYMYNEVSFWILDLVQPVTHAVGNTIKRVVLIVAAVLVFRAPVTMEGAIGSAIAIGGSLLYALAVQKYHPQSK
jgi:solute carrier family 35 protein E1